MAQSYINLGTYYIGVDTKKSIKYLNKALSVLFSIFDQNHYLITHTYNSLGCVYLEKKEYDKALSFFQKAINSDYTDSYRSPVFIFPFRNIGDIYIQKKEYNKALTYYNKALSIAKKRPKYYYKNIISINNSLGVLFFEQQQYKKALSYFDNAIKKNFLDNEDSITNNAIDLSDYLSAPRVFTSYTEKAKTLKELYIKNRKVENLEKVVRLYTQLDKLVDHSRESYQNYDDKVTLAEQAKEMYVDAVKSQLLVYYRTKKQKDLEKVYYYSGKSKSNILKELLLDSNAKNFAGLPQEISYLEKSLRSYRSFYQSQIVQEQSKDSIDQANIQKYEGKLFEITRRHDSITKVLEKEYPKYYQLKYKNTQISVSEIQGKLDNLSTLIEFFIADSTTYAFTISKNNFSVKELATPNLNEHLSSFKKAIVDKDIRLHAQLGHTIYTELMAPIKDKLIGERLIIIPDGALWQLNFDSLITQETSSKNPAQLPYLVQDYAISYANAVNLLFNPILHSGIPEKQEDCLAFSFSDSTPLADTKTMSLATLRDSGDDLPGTRREIKAIADILDGQYFYGSEAIERNFKKNAKNYNILHLALHGEIDNERPQNSKLYFTKSKDTLDDNLLYAHELFSLDIPSELVVLSACNTGAGKIAEGEGIMSLGNAFQYAGAKSLLLTSWEVSDQTTPELMKYFYTNLKKGMDKAKALQQAKLSYLQDADPNRTLPFYWSGFYLVGDAAPIHFENNSLLYWGIGLGILAIIFVVLFLVRRRA